MMGKVGQEVYLSLLRDAIEDAKGTEVTPVPLTRLHIPASKVDYLVYTKHLGLLRVTTIN